MHYSALCLTDNRLLQATYSMFRIVLPKSAMKVISYKQQRNKAKLHKKKSLTMNRTHTTWTL